MWHKQIADQCHNVTERHLHPQRGCNCEGCAGSHTDFIHVQREGSPSAAKSNPFWGQAPWNDAFIISDSTIQTFSILHNKFNAAVNCDSDKVFPSPSSKTLSGIMACFTVVSMHLMCFVSFFCSCLPFLLTPDFSPSAQAISPGFSMGI